MSKPQTIKVEPWVDFPKQPYSLAHEDFLHDKLAILKINAKTQNSAANIKASIANDKGYAMSNQVKLWFSLPANKWLYSKIKSTNYLKVHYEHGFFQKWGGQWNLYGSFNASKALENIIVKIGAIHRTPTHESDNRLKIEFGPDSRKNITFYNRTMIYYNKLTFGLVGAYSITQNFILKNNLFLGYRKSDQISQYVRLQNQNFRKTPIKWSNHKYYFDCIIFDYVRSIPDKNLTVVVDSNFSFREITNDLSGTIQHYNPISKVTTKLKVNCSLDVFGLIKFPSLILGDSATISLGFLASTLASNKRSFKMGGQVEFNV